MRGRARRANGEGSIRPSFASPRDARPALEARLRRGVTALDHPAEHLLARAVVDGVTDPGG